MAQRLTLFDLFGETNLTAVTSRWSRSIQPNLGLEATWPPSNLSAWLGELNNGVDVFNVRVGAQGDRIAVEAQLQLDTGRIARPDGFPFVLASMPDVEFRIQNLTAADKFVQLFASMSERGAEVVLEGLPVEIRLPAELVIPHPSPDGHPSGITEQSEGSFSAGGLDTLKVVYRKGNPTSIFVHVRLHMTEAGTFTLRPNVPISFGKCELSGMPCLAVHDFTLIPSPEGVPTDVEWIRHSVEPWLPDMNGPLTGLFTARSIHLDSTADPFKDAATWLNSNSTTEPAAEFVLDDLVVPFYSPYVVPIPRHITIGLRRRVLNPSDENQIFSFERAPIHTHLSRDPALSLIVESLFYKSLPSEELEKDLGLTFAAAIVFGDDSSDQHAFELGLGENYTLRIGYRRDFSSSTGMPAPGTGSAQTINALLHWEIATIVIDIMAIRLGYSLGRAIAEEASFGDSAEATVDVFVSMPPTGGDDAFFQLRALNGEKVAFAIEGLGWRQGAFHLEGVAFPDGVIAKLGPFKIILQEIALVAETGASYLSFTAGVAFPLPSGFEGAVVVRRMRFRVAGNPDAPAFKLDGFFARIKSATVLIEAGGYFTEQQVGDTRVREFGLTGTVGFELAAIQYLFGLDLLIGSRRSPSESFDYFMFQIFFRGSVMIAWFELRGARVLFANNMQPKLGTLDRESQDLRYYNWYKSSNPLTVSGDRRLAAWQAQNGSWALGIGVGASIAGLGKALELGVFVLVVVGDDENGFLIVGEVLALQNPRPIAFFALEWDGKNDRFSLLIGVNLTLDNFLQNPPSWSRNIARLTGTIFISNDPGTFAIGKLADQRTWLTLQFDINLWLRTFILFGFCFEYVDGPTGPKGVGLIVRVEGGIDGGIVQLLYHAGFGLLVMSFQTGSTDYAAAIWIEAGLRIVLFRFLRFGISARAEFRVVGSHPSRGEMKIELRLETPWFLPDITWTFEIVFGNLQPADLASAVTPLRIAAATEGLTQQSLTLYTERITDWNGEGTTPTLSINALRSLFLPEAERIARFEANTGLRAIATDSTIGIEFSVAVNDSLGLSTNVAPNLGNQISGDLSLSYDLVGLRVRRRSRFGSDRTWHLLEERIELTADFSDPSGVDLSGAFGPQVLTKFWDVDVQIGGQSATKKLLINATTPFEFKTQNPEVDEEVVRQNPDWPCCNPRKWRGQRYTLHEVIFQEEVPGIDLIAPRRFTNSQSRLNFQRQAWVRPQQFSPDWPANTLVAFVQTQDPGPVFRAELDQDAAFCFVQLAWTRSAFGLVLLAYDAQGNVIGNQTLPLGSGSPNQTLMLPAQGPIRRLELRLITAANKPSGDFFIYVPPPQSAQLEIQRVAYISLSEYLDALIQRDSCGDRDAVTQGYSGKGKLFFLPNHDYEIAITTRITVAHPSKPPESADITEYLYFKTKGLPGLNAVKRVGEEVEPYVNMAYTGGKGILYRAEPVTLAFNEDFHVAVPLVLRPPGTGEERTTLLRMQLLVQPETAPTLETPSTSTDEDWIVAHRTLPIVLVSGIWKALLTQSQTLGSPIVSLNPFRHRLATLTQRNQSRCILDDPRNAIAPVLVAPPQGAVDPDDASRSLWPASARFTARVRPEGAGFVDRPQFVPADATAFRYALDGSSGGGADWSVVENALQMSGGDRHFALFGEPTWNHLTIQVGLTTNRIAGVGVALPSGSIPHRGLFAVVEVTAAGRRLVLYQRRSGGEFAELAQATLPDEEAATVLGVTAYDDRLQATVGETSIEADRLDLREGCLGLVAQGTTRFTSLQVTGLDIFAFPFVVSRFRSFKDHIGSFDGTLDIIQPNALGPGTTTSTPAALWSATQTEIATAMQPDYDPALRQTLFDRWVQELGLPLKDEVTALELSRFVPAQTELLLLESPEPLDFTEEITLTLWQRRLIVIPFPGIPLPLDLPRLKQKPLIKPSNIERLTQIRAARRQVREDLAHFQGVTLPSLPEPVVTSELERSHLLQNVIRQEWGLQVQLDAAQLSPDLFPDGHLILAEVLESEGDRRIQFYRGRVQSSTRNSQVMVQAIAAYQLINQSSVSPLGISPSLAELEPGQIVVLTPDLGRIVDWLRPWYTYVPLEVRVLQDGTGHRALLVPLQAGNATSLSNGMYRLELELNRPRWKTLATPDDLNHYHDKATVTLQF